MNIYTFLAGGPNVNKSKREISSRAVTNGDQNADMRYMWLVAHLGESITHLNGSSVSVDERDRSERAFVRHYASALRDLEQQRNDKHDLSYLNKIPARYFALENKHGRLSKIVDIDLSKCSLDEETLNYRIAERNRINQRIKQYKIWNIPVNNVYKPKVDENVSKAIAQKNVNSNSCDLRVKLPGEGDDAGNEVVVVVKDVDLRQTVLELKRHLLRMVNEACEDNFQQSHSRYKLFHHSQSESDLKSDSTKQNEPVEKADSFNSSSILKMPASMVNKTGPQRELMKMELAMYNLKNVNVSSTDGFKSKNDEKLATKSEGKECKFMNRTLGQLRVRHNDLFEIVLV